MQLWVSHGIVTYTNNTSNVSIFSVINYPQKNSPNTVKFNFLRSDFGGVKSNIMYQEQS